MGSKFLLFVIFVKNLCDAYVSIDRFSVKPSFIGLSAVNELDVTLEKDMISGKVADTITTDNKEIESDSTFAEKISRENERKKKDKVKKTNSSHKEGVFSPAVVLAKKVVGDEELKKLRAKIIGLHTDVITSFVKTHESKLGQQALKILYVIADENKDGNNLIDFEEFSKEAPRTLKTNLTKLAKKNGN